MSNAATMTEVFYIDERTGWAYAPYDSDGIQTGDAAYAYRQRDAIAAAKRAHPDLEVHVYQRDGSLARIIENIDQQLRERAQ